MRDSSTSDTSGHFRHLRRAPVLGLSLALTLLVGACEDAASFDEPDHAAHVAMAMEEKPSPLEGKGTKYACSSARNTAAYEKAFTIAIRCRYGDQLFQTNPVGLTPLGQKLLAKKKYGCFCGPGSGGIDTLPLDGVDKCCKQHDERLWDLCQNVPAREGALPNIKNEGCDCYTKTPVPTCDADKKTISFPNWNDLDACQKACANDMEQLSACVRRHDLRLDNVGVDRDNACLPGDPPSAGSKENPVVYPPEEYKDAKRKKKPEAELPKPPTPAPLPRCPNKQARTFDGDETLDETCDTMLDAAPNDVVLEHAGGTSGSSMAD